MDAPQAPQTNDPVARPLPEADFSKMVAGALQAHTIEPSIDRVLRQVNPGNGSTIIGPDGIKPVRLNVPSAQDLGLINLQASRVILQTLRILLVALNDIDTRLRQQQAGKADPIPESDPSSISRMTPG